MTMKTEQEIRAIIERLRQETCDPMQTVQDAAELQGRILALEEVLDDPKPEPKEPNK